jgi:uncharacterized protein (DUF3820 family)
MEKGYEDIEMPFGSHKGELLADIPSSYLKWILDQEFVEEKYPKLYRLAKMEEQYRLNFNIKI